MFEEQDIFDKFALCPDYTTRLVFIKKNSSLVNTRFVDKLTLHAKIFLDEGEIPLAIELSDLALTASAYIDDKRAKSSSLILKSQLLQIRNDYDESEKLLFEAKELFDKEKMDDKLGDIYNLIAYLYKSQKKYDQALDYYKKAIDLSQKLEKKSSYALNLSAIGEIEFHRNRPQQALWHFEQSLNIYREIEDVKSLAQILNWVGYININLKNYNEASVRFMEVLDLLKDEKYQYNSSLAYSKFHLGTIHQHLSEPEKSLNYLLEALKIWKKREALQTLSEINFYWGKIFKSLGDKHESLNYFKQSLRLLQKTITRKGSLSLLLQIRDVGQTDDPKEPLNSFFAKNLNADPKNIDLLEDNYLFDILSNNYRDFIFKEEKNIYFNLATPSFSNKINIDALKENYRKHFAISHAHLSITFRQIASIYKNKGLTSYGLPYIIELLEIKDKFYHSSLVKQMLEGLNEISVNPGLEDEYKFYLQEIIRLLHKFVSNSDKALITYEAGLAYFTMGEYKKSDEILQKAVAISSKLKNKKTKAKVFRALAWCKYQEGHIDKSITYLIRALKIDGNIHGREELLDFLLLGRMFLEKKDFIKAIE